MSITQPELVNLLALVGAAFVVFLLLGLFFAFLEFVFDLILLSHRGWRWLARFIQQSYQRFAKN